MRDAVELAGMASMVAAAFLLSVPLGFAALGIFLVVAASYGRVPNRKVRR